MAGLFLPTDGMRGHATTRAKKAQLPWEIPGLIPHGPTSLVLSGSRSSPCQLYFHRDMFLAGWLSCLTFRRWSCPERYLHDVAGVVVVVVVAVVVSTELQKL